MTSDQDNRLAWRESASRQNTPQLLIIHFAIQSIEIYCMALECVHTRTENLIYRVKY